jgi:hypothetical protein
MSMLETAETVAKRYKISRERMDQYGAASQQKAAAALEAGLFKDEIAPITVTAGVADPKNGIRTKEVTVENDEGIRAGHDLRRHQGPALGAARRPDQRRQREPVQRRRRRLRGRLEPVRRAQEPEAHRPLPRLRRGRLRARRNGHRPRVRGAEGAQVAWA